MAQKLGLTYETVQTHFKHIRKLFHVHKTIQILQIICPYGGHIQNIVLTPREAEVFHLLEQGFTTKDIACHLHISISTVRRHKEKMLSVNGCTTFCELMSKYHGVKPNTP